MTYIDINLLPDQARQVLAVIRQCGGRPMLAGGCVRDAIRAPGTVPKDIDIEVYDLDGLERVGYALAEDRHRSRFTVNAVGVSFGVVKVRGHDGVSFDISLPRRDSLAPEAAGHRGITVTTDPGLDMAEACARRDFAVNAMLASPETGEVLDFWHGQDDLAAGVLRHTSAAFPQDPLRVLRAVRFASRLGFRLDPATATLCCQIAGRFTELATERIYWEFARIGTEGVFLSKALTALEDTGWEIWFPELAAMRGTPQEPSWHPEGDVWTHAGLTGDQAAKFADEAGLTGEDRMTVVLAALLHDCGKPGTTRIEHARIVSPQHAKAGAEVARTFLRRNGFPREIARRITPLIAEHMNCATRPTQPAVRRMARRLVPASMAELALVIHADASGRGDPDIRHGLADAWLEMAGKLTVTEKPRPGILTGHHLIAAGMDPGPAFGPILAQALAAQDDGAFTDEAGAVAWLGSQMAIAAGAALFPVEERA